jgi:hypothetical protein
MWISLLCPSKIGFQELNDILKGVSHRYLSVQALVSIQDESFLVVLSTLQLDFGVAISVVHVWLNELATEQACLVQLE